jgi:hypothetical protein
MSFRLASSLKDGSDIVAFLQEIEATRRPQNRFQRLVLTLHCRLAGEQLASAVRCNGHLSLDSARLERARQ